VTRAILGAIIAMACVGCTGGGGRINLTGRDLCWPDSQPRLATLMSGELKLGIYPWYLDTPEGETFQIDFAGPTLNSSADAVLDSNGNNIGNDGEMVTIFGGLDAKGIILVCAIDERHPA
jgi:hypothetical protein